MGLLSDINSEKGFSLTELMVSATILGILSMIATQQYLEYHVRARAGRAKTHLAELYAKNNVFRTHYQQFFGDWRNIGFQPEGNLEYRIGFSTSAPGASIGCPANYRGPGVAPGSSAAIYYSESSNGCAGGVCTELQEYACALVADCAWTANTLKACAATRTTDEGKIVISINEGKVFSTERDTNCGI